jgi:hypothetical protein
VAQFNGAGPSSTPAFTIAGGALQWRLVYHCATSPFTAVPVKESGEALPRRLADAAACGPEGKGYASAPGTYTLRIETAGTWDVKIEQQVDTALIEPLPPALNGLAPVAAAKVYGVDREGEGTAKLYRLPDGSALIRLEDFYTTINSDLELRLSPLPAPKSTDEIAAAPFASVAPMKATLGTMNYPVPANVDLAGYHSVVIWCEITRNAYAAASLAPSG